MLSSTPSFTPTTSQTIYTIKGSSYAAQLPALEACWKHRIFTGILRHPLSSGPKTGIAVYLWSSNGILPRYLTETKCSYAFHTCFGLFYGCLRQAEYTSQSIALSLSKQAIFPIGD